MAQPPKPKPVTAEEREQPRHEDPALLALEKEAAHAKPSQLGFFTETPAGILTTLPGGMTPLAHNSPLDLARGWYRQSLQQAHRPANTVDSYCYDLIKFEERIGHKPIDEITRGNVAIFLGEANSRATRKRRLTSLRRFFKYLIDDEKVIDADPTDGFFPHPIALKTPVPLFPADQQALLDAAAADEPWSLAAIWLMMRIGLSRSELLALRREHVDSSDPLQPVIYIFPEVAARRGQERKLGGDEEFSKIYAEFLVATETVDLLFPVGFQAVNGMVNRVAKNAGLTQSVTPQTLRHTFAFERARNGATEDDLIELLGLADDPRNRESVRRYLSLAEPPL